MLDCGPSLVTVVKLQTTQITSNTISVCVPPLPKQGLLCFKHLLHKPNSQARIQKTTPQSSSGPQAVATMQPGKLRRRQKEQSPGGESCEEAAKAWTTLAGNVGLPWPQFSLKLISFCGHAGWDYVNQQLFRWFNMKIHSHASPFSITQGGSSPNLEAKGRLFEQG